jgi:hypothetical protein
MKFLSFENSVSELPKQERQIQKLPRNTPKRNTDRANFYAIFNHRLNSVQVRIFLTANQNIQMKTLQNSYVYISVVFKQLLRFVYEII